MATRLLYILTAPQMAGFLRGQMAFLRESGMRITLCVPELTPAVERLAAEEGTAVVVCPMKRNISPASDLLAYIRLLRVIRREAPDITVTIGPKAGLIGGLASATCQVACRVQTKWGIRLETTTGALRILLLAADKLAAACAHAVFCDSQSGRQRTIELGLAPRHKVRVIAEGSANGIDVGRFSPNPENSRAAAAFRSSAGIPENAPLVGFVGRISRDKGLAELLGCWPLIRKRHPGACLALIGENECAESGEKTLFEALRRLPGVHVAGQMSGLERVFPAFDLLLLPSHREGFGVVVLEAAALGVPTVGFSVTGMKDSVVPGETGQLVAFGDVAGLADATCAYLSDPGLRARHGDAGRRRVSERFRREQVWEGYLAAYRELASERGVRQPVKR